MIGELLFETRDRDECHRWYNDLDKEKYPVAEVREDNGQRVYQVWSGPQAPNPNTVWEKPKDEPAAAAPEAQVQVKLDESEILRIAVALGNVLKKTGIE